MFFFKISMSFLKAFFKDIHNFTFWPVDMPLYKAKFNLHTATSESIQISDSIKVTLFIFSLIIAK